MAEQDTEGTPEKFFDIRKLYVKDASLEAPNSPATFPEATGQAWKPDIQVELDYASSQAGESLHEVVLSVTVIAKQEGTTAYLVEIHQAGLFVAQGFSSDEIEHLLATFCPATLFPFVREAIADMVGRAGFPRLYIRPVNFDVLHMQRTRADAQSSGETSA